MRRFLSSLVAAFVSVQALPALAEPATIDRELLEDNGFKLLANAGYPKNSTAMHRAADAGDAIAKLLLGFAYLEGVGVKKDKQVAQVYLRQAKAAGLSRASGFLCYASNAQPGEPTPSDCQEAIRLGLPEGILYTVVMAMGSDPGKLKDSATFKSAMARGLARGDAGIRMYYSFFLEQGFGYPKDLAEAVRQSQLAAAEDFHPALLDMYFRYEAGNGVPLDKAKALQKARRLAELGSSYSRIYGAALLQGTVVPQNVPEGLRLLEFAAGQGDVPAFEQLTSFYLTDGEHFSPAKAGDWLARYEAEVGEMVTFDTSKYLALGRAYRSGTGVDPDAAKAESYFSTCAEMDAECSLELGIMYQRGLGVPKDIEAAIGWYQMASDLGSEQAKALVEALTTGP